MINELLLLGSLVVIFSSALIAYYIFGKAGLYAVTAIATITANIECLILVNAFGMEQTLGNVFFAVTFLATGMVIARIVITTRTIRPFFSLFCIIFFASRCKCFCKIK